MNKTVFISFIICLLGLSTTYSTYAQDNSDITLRNDRPDNYTVIAGDTLWDISSRFLEDPWRWKEIWQGNTQITNPDLIFPGDTIELVIVDGKPQLVINGEESTQPASSSTSTNQIEPVKYSSKALKTVKLSPKIHVTPIKTAVESIPLERINTFLIQNRVVETDTLSSAPYIIAGQEDRVILSAGDRVYARGDFSSSIASYNLYRAGQRYIDPITEEILGVQAVDIGAIGLRALTDDVGTFTITRSTNEIRIGDRLLPNRERDIQSIFLPSPPENSVEGLIMNVETGVSQAGRLDIIAINLGHREGMKQGDLLGIFKHGSTIRDRNAGKKISKTITLPDERAGLIMVFEVFEKMSLAIVLNAERGVGLQDIVRNP